MHFNSFNLIFGKKISMTAQVIPVRTTAPVQTKSTNSTAAAQQDLMEHNVNQVTVSRAFPLFYECVLCVKKYGIS